MSARESSPFSESITLEIEVVEQLARTIERSIRVEAADLADDRTKTEVGRSGRTVTIEIVAQDLVGLRAAANTWLSLVRTAETTATALDRRV